MLHTPGFVGALVLATGGLAFSQSPPAGTTAARARFYIEEKLKTTSGASVHCDDFGNCYGQNLSTTRNVSLEVTRQRVKTSPAVTVTSNREAADYVLRISPGSSTLYQQNGDVAYVSPARWRVASLAKDVCSYVQSHDAAK